MVSGQSPGTAELRGASWTPGPPDELGIEGLGALRGLRRLQLFHNALTSTEGLDAEKVAEMMNKFQSTIRALLCKQSFTAPHDNNNEYHADTASDARL